MKKIKPFLRWFIIGFTLFFIINTFRQYWLEVINVRLNLQGFLLLILGLLLVTIAHCWSAFVWTWIIESFNVNLAKIEGISIYLKTNLAKYLPGNVWHFYGRIVAIKEAGGSLEIASFSVLLEPILMAVAAFTFALIGGNINNNIYFFILQIIGLISILVSIHPLIINNIIKFLNRLKNSSELTKNIGIKSYPWLPLSGAMFYIILRGTGFLITLSAFIDIKINEILPLFSAFSFAWLLGFIVPGAPGGLGVFEATMMTVLGDNLSGQIIVAIAIFRLISISAEIISLGFIWIINQEIKLLNK